MSIQKIYTATAKATGGRDGRAISSDNVIDLPLSTPKEMGGPGKTGATNPEQLFAAGYAACFDGALNLVARMSKTPITGSTVDAQVSFGKDGDNYGLEVALNVNIPGFTQQQAEELVAKAHQVCPYSRATRGNIDVHLNTTVN
ncbi:organic hydroperoxide resistance protein [Hymenobacter jejuensis]|uniref:Organic hydroperoxide resistance protein n=1 Tax=Hymenobacter jejuensis TaxID=2502781 RepID=A0A5B7ZVG2_9BACT|nr:organic hydroperoxide resistance protein [Hymenobacter jejuensis]QDA58998.1 organic hydroperoxide resistance protein [Hymenobacter jejuensis]